MSAVPGWAEKRQVDELSEEERCKGYKVMKPETAEKNRETATTQKSQLFNENLKVPTGWELEPIFHFKENNKLS